eukprot:CAMPEP_0119543626 /NCGR_PEP_ID=MMETSP1344-20130328/54234_1 /TAXON_ID=236787 /ORGANISM="Florenciella parvula, Strain CCMP2471" /LENGTH=60 /DNA_ID=CAMNT_0007587951 /DNA_START=169 /DNA_END=347 /DNA_ORIENTATION=-
MSMSVSVSVNMGGAPRWTTDSVQSSPLNPQPSTLNPQPSTLNPQPSPSLPRPSPLTPPLA